MLKLPHIFLLNGSLIYASFKRSTLRSVNRVALATATSGPYATTRLVAMPYNLLNNFFKYLLKKKMAGIEWFL